MKISTMLSYAGGFRKAAAQVAEMEKAGPRPGVGGRGLRHRQPEPDGLPGRPDRDGGDRLGHPAHLHPDPDAHRHDGGRHRRPVRGPFPPRAGLLGAPGHRGLARGALRRPARSDPGDRRRLSAGVGPRGTARAPRPLLRHAASRGPGDRPGQGAQDHRPSGAAADPDLGGLAGPQERGHDRGDRRRLDPHALRAREGPGRVGRVARCRSGRAGPVARPAADHRRRHGGHRGG